MSARAPPRRASHPVPERGLNINNSRDEVTCRYLNAASAFGSNFSAFAWIASTVGSVSITACASCPPDMARSASRERAQRARLAAGMSAPGLGRFFFALGDFGVLGPSSTEEKSLSSDLAAAVTSS